MNILLTVSYVSKATYLVDVDNNIRVRLLCYAFACLF